MTRTPPSNLHIQFSFREVQTTLNIGQGIGSGQYFARLLSECGEEDMSKGNRTTSTVTPFVSVCS